MATSDKLASQVPTIAELADLYRKAIRGIDNKRTLEPSEFARRSAGAAAGMLAEASILLDLVSNPPPFLR